MGPTERRGAPAGALDVDVVRTAARAFERDRYLAALLAPSAVRGDLIALAAFAGELARIPAYVSEPMVGEIRLQWWRDTITAGLARLDGEVSGEEAGHPVAAAVIAAARRHALPTLALLDLIEAQSIRLDDMPFATLDGLLDNARVWDGGLFTLAWRIIAGEASRNAVAPPMLAQAGAVYGLARILLETPVDLTQGRCLLPADICRRHGATLGVAVSPENIAAFDRARADVVSAATPMIPSMPIRFQEAPREARCAALPIALVQPYLALSRRELAAAGQHDVSPITRVWRLWLTHRRGRIATW